MPEVIVCRFDRRDRRKSAGVMAPVLGGGCGAAAFAALALAADLGWIAALFAYGLGGVAGLAALAGRAALAERTPVHRLHPVLNRNARSLR